jgi:hypothetical protein
MPLAAIALSILAYVGLCHAQQTLPAQGDEPNNPWTMLPEFSDAVLAGEEWIRPHHYQAASINTPAAREMLASAPIETDPHA